MCSPTVLVCVGGCDMQKRLVILVCCPFLDNREQQSLPQQRSMFGVCTVQTASSHVLHICTHVHTTIITVILFRYWHAAHYIFFHVVRINNVLVFKPLVFTVSTVGAFEGL